MTRSIGIAALLALALFQAADASYFGQNKVRYRDLEWRVIETAHFRIHFYDEESDLALETVGLAEAIYDDLSARLDHGIERPIPLVLYGSHPEFQSTSITSYLIDEGTGGVTEFLKRRVFLPYPGSREEYRHVLEHELVHAFQIDILDADGSSGLGDTAVPLWMIEGMAEYLSKGGVDPFTRMWIRDALLDGPPPTFASLAYYRDVRIYRFGQSAWAYLAAEYGDVSAGDFLRALALCRDADKALGMVFHTDADELSDDWLDALRREYLPGVADLERASCAGEKVSAAGRVNVAPDLSPDGSELLVLSDREGELGLYADPVDGASRPRLIVREGRSPEIVSLRPFHGGGRWSPDGSRLLVPAQAGDQDALHLIDAASGKVVRTFRAGFEETRGIAWSPDGRYAVVAGLADGSTDLYGIDLETGETTRLTADRFLYLHPDWSPDGERVVVATDRVFDGEPVPANRSLRLATLRLADGTWEPLPGQEGNNHSPAWSPEGDRVAFVSSRAGTPDVYLLDLATRSLRRLTRLEAGVAGLVADSRALSWGRGSGEIAFVAFRRQSWAVHVMPDPGYAPGVCVASRTVLEGPEAPDASPGASFPAAYLPPYRVRPYRPRLTADVQAAGAGAAPDGSFSSGSSVAFSDLLGGHELEVAFGIYGSMSNSDLHVAYRNRVRRTEYEAAAFQFRRALLDWDGTVREALYRGARWSFLYPLDRYRRVEYGARVGEGNDGVFHDLEPGGTVAFAGLEFAFVHDDVAWSAAGPSRGRRLRFSFEPTYASGAGAWTRLDARIYHPAGDRVTLASRTVAGRATGAAGPVLGFGYRGLVRGFPELTEREEGYAVQSLEVRFPLIDAIRLGWPFPITIGGIRGVLFADAGSFEGEARPRFAYGPGVRTYFGPFHLMLDFPTKSDGRHTLGATSGYFRIGREF